MRAPIALVWFRRDLRVLDQPTLDFALRNQLKIVPLFILEDPQDSGNWPMGSASKVWLNESLQALELSLRLLGSRLILRKGPALEVLQELLHETRASHVVFNRRFEPAHQEVDRKIHQQLTQMGVSVQVFNGSLLFDPDRVQNSSGKPFQVYTHFWNHLRPHLSQAPVQTETRALPSPSHWPHSLPLSQLNLLPKPEWHRSVLKGWSVGEKSAHQKLRAFQVNQASEYRNQRDFPDIEATSRLSPHLHFGEVSPRQIIQQIPLTPDNNPGSETFLKQILWREFSYHLLHHFPQTPDYPLRPAFHSFPWKKNPTFYQHWTQGTTGYPIVDAGMRQLYATGWMHNRVRMITASFLVKHLLVPWRQGASWFWDTLFDADLANNTMGWQWTAGCGADAAPYFRIFNPITQSQKFDPQGTYIRRWVPEVQSLPTSLLHAPWEAPHPPAHYPPPIVHHPEARALALQAFHTLPKSPPQKKSKKIEQNL